MAKPSHKPATEAPGARARQSIRVVLVGRTGLDGRLRLDDGLELARVRSALEAVGELSQHLEEFESRVVVVAADADPGAVSFAGQPADAARAREFIAALRVVDPAVRVLRLEGEDGEAPIRAGYDGIVAADADAEVLRAIIANGVEHVTEVAAKKRASREESPVPAPKPPPAAPPAVPVEPPLPDVPPSPIPVFPPTIEPEPDEEEEEEETPEPKIAPRAGEAEPSERAAEPMYAPAMSRAGDEMLVRLLLQGRDVTDAAVELLRNRLGGRDVVFTSAGRIGRDGAGQRGQTRGGDEQDVSVSWRGRQYGHLRARGLRLDELAPHAAWLGSWLALRDQHSQLRQAAFTDPLTNAYNRRFFDHFLVTAIEQAREERRSLTLLMFDIDNFKQFNDEYGHAAGDEILIEAVRLLQSMIRPSDKVCRIGGDEFVVIFHEPTGPRSPTSKHPSDIFQIAQRFQKAICEHRFPKLGREAPGTLTISGGLATYPWDGSTSETLLDRADQLSLQSKKQGKNCITLGPGAEREHGCG